MNHCYYEYVETDDDVFLVAAEEIIAAETFKEAKHELLHIYRVGGSWSVSANPKGIFNLRQAKSKRDVQKRLMIWESPTN